MSESFDEFQRAPNEWDEFEPATPGPSTRDVLKAVSKIQPEQAARAAKLAKKYDAPNDVLLRTLQDVEMVDRVNAATAKLDKAPKLSEYMRSSPFVAAQAQKDIDPLVEIESGLGALSAAGVVQATLGISESIWRTPDAAQRMVGYVAGQIERTGLPWYLNPVRGVQDFIRILSEGQLPVGPKFMAGTTDVADKISDAQKLLSSDPDTFGSAFADMVTLGKNADKALEVALKDGNVAPLAEVFASPEYWAAGLSQAAPSLYAAIKSGGSTAFLAWMEGMEQASNAAEFEERTGIKVSDAEFAQSVMQTALINGWLEKSGLDKVMGAGGKGLRGIGMAALGEGTTETLQTINTNLSALLAYDDGKNILEGVVASFMGGVGSGGGVAAARASAEKAQEILTKRAQEIERTQNDAAKLQTLMAAAAKTTLRENNPETFAQLVQHLANNAEGAPTSLYIDGQVLNQAVQSLTPEQVAQAFPSLSQEQIAEAAASNTTVEIPVGELMAAVPGTPLEQVFLQNVRTTPDSLSLADVQQRGEQANQLIQAEAERVMQQAQDQAAWQASMESVKATILDQLNQVGRFAPSVNEAYATLQMNFFSTMAARLGMTPEALYQEWSLKVAGAQQASADPVLNSGIKPGIKPGELTVEGYHFSKAPRPTISTRFFGTGLRGSNRDLYANAADTRLRNRAYFYVDKGTGINPESGVGGIAQRANLSNIYDSDADPLKLKRGADQLAFESAVLDAGFSGYLVRLEGTQSGQVILLGDQSVQAEVLGPTTRIPAGQRVPALPRQAPQWQVQASGTPEQLQARLDRMQSSPAWADYEMRIEGNELQVRKKGGVFEQSVSTRLPTAKKALENPLEDMLIIGLEAAKADPKAFEKNIELIRQYPNFRDNKSASTPDKAAEQFIKHVIDNLLWLYDQVPAETRERSKLWYDGARAIVDRWVPKYGVTDAQVAGMLAVLSPQKDWFQNVSLAERVLDIMTTKQDFAWSDEMSQTAAGIGALNPEDVGEITGKTLGEIDSNDLQAVWVRVYDQTYNERGYRVVSPEGDFTDWVYNTDGTTKSKAAWGSFTEIGKAISIFKDGSIANISASLGEQHKVRNFYNNIFNPASQHGDVTIDTHAVAAGLLRPLSGSATEVLHNFGAGGAASSSVFGSKGTYGIYAEAYRRAAEQRGVLPREMQSIAWEAVRGLYTAGFKAQASNVAKIDAVWVQYKKRRISLDEARKQLLDLSGGIAAPEWERPSAGAPEAAWASSYTGELRQDGGADRTAGRGDRGVLAQSEPGGLTDGRPEQTGDRGGRYSSGSLAPLEGAPVVAGATGPDPKLVAVAEQYARDNGIDLRRQDRFVEVDEARAARIAQAYAEMPHAPNDPKVKEAYDDLIRQTRAQYDALVAAGYQFTFFDDTTDPYGGNPWNAMRDLRANQRMAVYGTYAGFGVGAQVNIGLADPNGGENLDPAAVLQALRDVGAEVEVFNVFSSDTEPTLVAKIKQALTKEQGDKVSEMLGQEAIAQRTDDEKGQLFGPMAEKWGPYNPSYFVTVTGDRADAIANPMLQDTGLEWPDQNGEMRPVLANDLFRAVHDAFGHGLEGAGFRARGEENAWQAHVRLFTGPAVGAITSETRGQNSWLNYGPYGEHNRTAKVEDTVFAEQKTGLMPEWTWTEGRAGDMPDQVLEQGPRGTFNPQSLLITLNDNANLSTFLHESGHFFLEVLADLASRPDAPQQIRDDMDKVLAWFGIKGDEQVGGPDAGGELAQSMPDTIEVDGVQRPTTNSNGQRIATTEQGLVNFWRWFGDSKVVDAEGRPLVVYRGEGTGGDFEQFDRRMTGENAFFFTADKSIASVYARGQEPRQFYLKSEKLVDITRGKDSADFIRKWAKVWDEWVDRQSGEEVDPVEYVREGRLFDYEGDWSGERWKDLQATIESEGFDGAVLPDWDNDTGMFKAIVVFTPTQIKSATGNTGNFDPTNPSILAQNGNLPQDNTQPAGRTPLDVWRAMTLDQKRPYHEKWAESFEQYLLEGKAPSQELQSLFRTFRSWLINVYKSLKEIFTGAEQRLSPEIRQVFDRMLATDEQIAAAEEAAGMMPDFDATNEAIEKLQSRSLRDLKWTVNARSKAIKELQKQAATLRKSIEAEVRAEVEQQPVYRAMLWLKKGETTDPDTGEAVKAEKGFRLSTTALAEMYPDSMLSRPDLDKLRGMKAKDGLHPDLVADMFGFPSGDALVRAIIDAEPLASVVEGITDQRMLERHGDLVDQRAIEEAANEAVHNEARARALATELRSQAEMLNPRQDTGRTSSNGRPITVNAIAAAAKDFAANLAARRKVKDLKSAAWQHRAAEARAAKAWQDATAKGKTQEAVQAKRDQVLNNAAAKALLEAQTEVKKIRDFFARVTKGNDEKVVERGRDPDVVNAMRAVLAAYNVAPRLGKSALEYMETVSRNDPAMYAALKPGVDAALFAARPVEDLTMEELRGLNDELRAMWELAKRSRQMEVDGNLLDIEEAADQLLARMDEIGVPDEIPGEKGAITARQELGLKLQFAKAILSRVEQWAERLDGKFGGPFLRLVFQPVKEAADRYRTDKVAYRKKFTALVDNIATLMPPGPIAAPELGYTFGNARDSGVAELLHAILHTGNDSNKRKLLLGRGWASENPDGTIDTARWDAFIKRMVDEGKIQKAHYDFAQGVWDLLEEMKPLAQETHRKVFGRYFAEVTANEVVTPFGTYRGGYVPAQTDSRLVNDAKLRELAEGENESMVYAFPASPSGFTKARVEYNKPLLLDLRALGQHMDKVLLFSHMQGAVTDVRRLLTNKRVSYALDRIDPGAYEGMLIPWLNRAAKQIVETPVVGDRKLSRFLSAARSRAGMALMFANLSNTVQQITGFSLAAVKVRPNLMMKATAAFIASPKETKRTVAEASEYMKGRMLNEVGALNDAVEQILVNPSMLERGQAWTQQHAYFMQAAVDNTMSPIIWTAAYNQAIEDGMGAKDAIRFADGVIRQTQGTTLPEDISRFESGPAYGRLFTQFIGYFNMMANTNATAVKQIVDEMGVRKGAGKLLYVALAGLLVPIWVAETIALAFRGGPEDEDDDGWLDDWLAAVFGLGTVRGLVAQVPLVGQAAQLVVNRFNDNPADDKFSLSPAVSLIESSVSAPASVYKAIVDDGNKQKAVRDVAAAATLITGLPIYAAARPIGYATGIADDRIDPTGPVDLTRGLITGTASPESKQP